MLSTLIRGAAPGSWLLRVLRRRPPGRLNIAQAIARMAEQSTPAVIIVPIHNAAAELDACLAALLANTPATIRIVLLDDASSDPRVAASLAACDGLANVEIHRNAQNLGFTRTVNRGLDLAGRADVVLLNADTRVTPRWLDNLHLAAWSGDRIGTATPFSSNAGAFSAPSPDRPNPLPDWLDLDSYGRLVTQASARSYPRVPTGSGFCLYIRRACLDEVGGFDAEAFPRGYGEENDFCMRASRRGWGHVVDDATLIDHVRSASFGDEKAELLKRAGAILRERYPDYPALVRRLGRDRRLARARRRIASATDRSRRSGEPVRPRLLTVIATTVGGTPQTNRDLMAALADRYETYVLHSDSRTLTLTRFRAGRSDMLERARLPRPLQPFPHTEPDYDRIVAGWLAAYAIEVVHIRHIGWHSLSLPHLARGLAIPVVFSFHDYYAICPSVRLVDADGLFCAGTCAGRPGHCPHGLWRGRTVAPVPHAALPDWRAAMAGMLAACDALVTTSPAARDLLERFFPVTGGKPFLVVGHGRDFARFERPRRLPEPGERLRVLVPGNLSASKGADVVRDVARIDAGRTLEFHVVGRPGRDLKRLPGVVLHGPYERDDLPAIVRGIGPHLGAVFSIWPETYCHTLTEMWACGVPVAAFDLGAVGERIRAHGGGWLIADKTAAGAYEALRSIAADRAEMEARLVEVDAWQDGLGSTETTAWMADAYERLYRSLWQKQSLRTDVTANPVPRAAV